MVALGKCPKLRTAAAWMILLLACTGSVVAEDQVFRNPLVRGPECTTSTYYPSTVNLHFERIRLVDALKLLAEFSCNKYSTNLGPDVFVLVDYSSQPWDAVVREICSEYGLSCWTESETLYVWNNGRSVQKLAVPNAGPKTK